MNENGHNKSPFEPDPIWKSFVNGKSLEQFQASYPTFRYRQQVPVEIRRQLDDVHALLIHSYYRYRFLDIAHTRAMQIIEMALRARHDELEGGDLVHRASLNKLIRWASRKGLTEESEERSQLLRKIRNFAVHAKADVLYGVTTIPTIYSAVDFVNALYENVERRTLRHSIEREVQEALSKIAADGAILIMPIARMCILQARVLYCDLRNDGCRISIAFVPVFDPKEVDGETQMPVPIYFECSSWSAESNFVDLVNQSGSRVRLQTIEDQEDREYYNEFGSVFAVRPILQAPIQLALSERRRTILRTAIRVESDL